eukprot:17315_1
MSQVSTVISSALPTTIQSMRTVFEKVFGSCRKVHTHRGSKFRPKLLEAQHAVRAVFQAHGRVDVPQTGLAPAEGAASANQLQVGQVVVEAVLLKRVSALRDMIGCIVRKAVGGSERN